MDGANQQDQFGQAYLKAVVARAGYLLREAPKPDLDCVDNDVAAPGPMGTLRSPQVNLQLKTWRGVPEGDPFPYALKVRNYENLRHADYQVPRVLVLIVLPTHEDDWIEQSEDALLLKRCGYWLSLRGMPPTTNEEKVTVHLPRSQILTPDALSAMMFRIGSGGLP